MDKITMRENYGDYERVKKAFKEFVRALVWESADIAEGVDECEVNSYINRYCYIASDDAIRETNKSITEYIKTLSSRYVVHLYEHDENGIINEETAEHFETDNLVLALQKGAEFYRYHGDKHPTVDIFDNQTYKYLAEWN